jgi:hypothetical protein
MFVCTNLATYDLITPLERELGKPVLTANQATMWRGYGLPTKPTCSRKVNRPICLDFIPCRDLSG